MNGEEFVDLVKEKLGDEAPSTMVKVLVTHGDGSASWAWITAVGIHEFQDIEGTSRVLALQIKESVHGN